jgi:hypothetical protein
MDARVIRKALADISAEKDATLKSIKLASLCSALWAERGIELVVVGGSAIEFLTEGAYASGDLDMCHTTAATLPIRDRQEIMGLQEVQRVAQWPEYHNIEECEALVSEVANELKIKSPFDPH